jgi:signal transduction histidine kinase
VIDMSKMPHQPGHALVPASTESPEAATPMRWSTEALQAREQAREEERRRLARELHDDLGQALTGVKLQLSWFEHRFAEPPLSEVTEVLEKVQMMRQLIDQAMQTVRNVITELRPEALDRLGLVAALEWQAETFARHAGLRCRFTATKDVVDLDVGRATSVFRIFQEMLTNVARHAVASRVDVTIEQHNAELMLTVHDNGRGFSPESAVSSRAFGLLGMRERALLLGGSIDVSSVPRRGTTVSLRVPLANRRSASRPEINGSHHDQTAHRR